MPGNLQKIYAHQEIMQKSGGESLCHTAVLRCDYGSQEFVLNLQKGHGKYIGTHTQIDAKDGKQAYFGYCRKLDGPCRAKLSDWYGANQSDLMFDESTLKMEASVQKDAGFMICTAVRRE